MRHLILGVFVLAALAPVYAQDLKADEVAIRALIARQNETGTQVPAVRGFVFWSGAYKAPVMGDERPVEIAQPRAPTNRVSNKQHVNVNRLEVAASGDMAWEYSTGQMSYELKDGTKGAITNSLLRVWRKDAGQWKVAAHFSRPHSD